MKKAGGLQPLTCPQGAPSASVLTAATYDVNLNTIHRQHDMLNPLPHKHARATCIAVSATTSGLHTVLTRTNPLPPLQMETESSRRAVAPVAPCKSAAGMASTTAPTGVGRLKAVFIYINILYNSMGQSHCDTWTPQWPAFDGRRHQQL